MKKELLKTNIKRESGKLYYCGTDSKGNIIVCETEMKHSGRKKKGGKK